MGVKPRQGRGAAAVEVAVVIVVVFLLLGGIVSYGYMLAFRQAMSQASEAASDVVPSVATVSSSGNWRARVEETVTRGLDGYGVRCADGDLLRGGSVVGRCLVSEPSLCVFERGSNTRCVTVVLDYRYRDHSLLPTLPGMGFVLPDRLHFGKEVALS